MRGRASGVASELGPGARSAGRSGRATSSKAEERAEAEHRAWREQAEAARLRSEREREVLQGVLDRLQQEIAPLRGERETTRTLIESLTREREQMTTFRDQLKASFQEREKAYQARITQLGQALQQAIQEKDADAAAG